ncbi:holo-ACP synthase [Leptolyngbyaceae cyanobacterium CCMR0082]|uniref:Holo-ACP synthase n=1 Tax=Adonisia turfae CCMR0082 TaxID=2304604 RepID=A0A6M0RZB3_9CYAN|nr:holo-ACP synthase [Adonisia turfae]NEZ61544.1 holo-ACP synthase [Adonisia turfae CCMR0082]
MEMPEMMIDIERQISQSLSDGHPNYSNVVSHGIYLVDISRFQLLRDQLGKSLEQHCFTEQEQRNAFVGTRRLHFFAGRLAGKNAVVRALGRDNVPENSWQSIDIQKLPSGQPLVVLKGEVQNVARQLRIKTWLLSISHTSTYAIASAIALSSK